MFRMLGMACTLALCFSSLSAQQAIDVFPDKTYITWFHDRTILELNPIDWSVKRHSNILPENTSTRDKPRPKIRLDRVWMSDGKRIMSKPLESSDKGLLERLGGLLVGEWEQIKLPENIAEFKDFEILSDKEALICGAMFTGPNPSSTRFDIHFIFNYQTGAITRVIESFDPEFIAKVAKTPRMPDEAFYTILQTIRSYTSRFNSMILIVGSFSGFVTILDVDTKRTRKIEIVPKKELPGDPEKVVNYLPVIPWVSPLPGYEVLFCCRFWAPQAEDPSKSESIYVFRTLDLRTGKVTLHGHEYLDQKAAVGVTLIEKDGQLAPVSEVTKHKFDASKVR